MVRETRRGPGGTLRIDELFSGIDVVETSDPSVDIKTVGGLPQHVGPSGAFFKLKSPTMHLTAAAALAEGAGHVVLEEGDPEAATLPPAVPRTIVRNVNRAYAAACANLSRNAHRKMTFIGVTGTKGKTTVCHLVDAALRKAGVRTALISSLALRFPDGSERPAMNTTPDPLLLHLFLMEALRKKATHVIMEVSSIGIAEERMHGLRFQSVAFTNLGSDHFEYHGGRGNYIAAKQRLLCDPSLHASISTLCVINGDDAVGRELAAAAGRVQTYGLRDGTVTPEEYSFDESGMTIRVGGRQLRLPLLGEHNVSNALAAVALTAEVLGSVPAAIAAMNDAPPIPGRLQRIPTSLGVQVYVDYAHTPESVEAVLDTIAAIAGGKRRIAVVGCSGNSDRRKRPLIARAAAAASDICILTSDNPNHEHPASIIRDMIAGLRGRAELRTIIDRPTAIAQAIELAHPDGVVVILGKGTERFQLINGKRIPHNDATVAARILSSLEQA